MPAALSAAALFLALTETETVRADLVTYPGPPGIKASDQYAVEVRQSGAAQPLFTYLVKSQWRSNKHPDASWTTFSFSGRVTVEVTRLRGAPRTCRVLPTSTGIQPRLQGNRASFELERPCQISVEFDGDVKHPMLLFADPLETDAPKPTDANTLYFGPGVHDLGPEPLALKPHQTVYLAGGAYVYGRFYGRNAPNVRILGRGVLSGEKFPETDANGKKAAHFIALEYTCPNCLAEGITLANSPQYNINLDGRGSRIRNLKCISWWFCTDGACVGQDSTVEDSFFMVNDDALKLYQSGTTVRRCVIWQLENGAPFQLSWNMGGEHHGFHVSDCDVIRVEHEWNNPNEAVFDSIHGGSGRLSNYLFENIRIENAPWRLVYLTIATNEFARSDRMGIISNVTFRNITVTGPAPKLPNTIKGWDAEHRVSAVTFENVRLNGRPWTSAREARFEIDPATTADIRFIASPAQPGTIP